jgi:hypothetical protein
MTGNVHAIQTYRAPAEIVTAIQFRGWQNADTIRKWAEDVFYVPRGYEHKERSQNEYDRSNAHLLEDAPEFLVIKGYGGDQRTDIGDWVVRIEGDDGNGTESVEFRVFSDEEFNASYTQPDIAPMQAALTRLFSEATYTNSPKDFYDDYNVLAEALGLETKQ